MHNRLINNLSCNIFLQFMAKAFTYVMTLKVNQLFGYCTNNQLITVIYQIIPYSAISVVYHVRLY